MNSRKIGASFGVLLAMVGVSALPGRAQAAGTGTDLVVSQTASPQPGGALTLAIVVRNAGPSSATAIAVRELLNANGVTAMSHVSNRSTNCWAVKPPVGYTLGRKCQIARLEAGQSWNLTFTVRAPTGTPVTAKANLAATVPDLNAGNNAATVSSWAGPVADLAVRFTSPPVYETLGSVFQTVAVVNAGPNAAADAFVTTDEHGSLSGPGCGSGWGSPCQIGQLLPGMKWEGVLYYAVGGSAPQLSAYGRSFDPQLADNALLAPGS